MKTEKEGIKELVPDGRALYNSAGNLSQGLKMRGQEIFQDA